MPQGTRSFQDLEVWQKACDLVEAVFLLTERFPTEDRYGLTSQLRRAVVSIAPTSPKARAVGDRKSAAIT